MYDADYENYVNELREEAEETGFEVRDSGKKAQYDDGMQRDDPTGKPKFGLMWPKDVPYEEQLIYRVAMHYMHGGKKYGDRNWEKSCTYESLAAHEEALWRHFTKFYADIEDGEDHAAAVVWNVNAVLLTRRNIGLKKTAETIKAAESIFPEHLMPGEEAVKLKLYTFPYTGKDTAFTGQFCQRQFYAGCYEEARMMFDNWYATQPYYNGVPDIPETSLPSDLTDAELEWAEGDVLEEVKKSPDGKPYTWCYKRYGDIWLYQPPDGKPCPPDSARSSKKLLADFGPLKCTKGSHTGRVVDGT